MKPYEAIVCKNDSGGKRDTLNKVPIRRNISLLKSHYQRTRKLRRRRTTYYYFSYLNNCKVMLQSYEFIYFTNQNLSTYKIKRHSQFFFKKKVFFNIFLVNQKQISMRTL